MKKRAVVTVVLAVFFISLLSEWISFFGGGWGWWPEHQKRELTAPEG